MSEIDPDARLRPGEPLSTDIRRQWFNVIRRVQSAAFRNHSFAVVTMHILVGPNGLPLTWTEPKITLLEPSQNEAGDIARKAILELLAD